MPTALEKALADAARIAAQYGLEVDTDSIVHADEIQAEKEVARQANTNALEVVLNTLHHKHATMLKICGYCREKFYTTYCYHNFCSDRCRTAEFIEHFGVDPAKLRPPASFWEYEDVGVVPTALTQKLYGWAKFLVTQFESLTDQEYAALPLGPEEPSSDPASGVEQSLGTPKAPAEEGHEPLPATLLSTLDSLESLEIDLSFD